MSIIWAVVITLIIVLTLCSNFKYESLVSDKALHEVIFGKHNIILVLGYFFLGAKSRLFVTSAKFSTGIYVSTILFCKQHRSGVGWCYSFICQVDDLWLPFKNTVLFSIMGLLVLSYCRFFSHLISVSNLSTVEKYSGNGFSSCRLDIEFLPFERGIV